MRKEFSSPHLSMDGARLTDLVSGAFEEFLNKLEEVCGVDGREMAVVRTKLEEAHAFAKKAIASKPYNRDLSPADYVEAGQKAK